MDTYDGTARSSRTSLVRAIHTAVVGRTRYHVVGLHHSKPLKQYLEQHLQAEAGIQRVSANPWTGNVLVHFNPALGIATIAHRLEQIVSQYYNVRGSLIAKQPSADAATHHEAGSQLRSTHPPDPSSFSVSAVWIRICKSNSLNRGTGLKRAMCLEPCELLPLLG